MGGAVHKIAKAEPSNMTAQTLIRVEGLLPTCATICFGSLFLGLFSYGVASMLLDDATETPTAFLDAKRYHPIILVSLGWNALYFCFLQGQAAAAFWMHKVRREAASKGVEASPQLTNRTCKSIDFADVKYGRERANAGLIFTMGVLPALSPGPLDSCHCLLTVANPYVPGSTPATADRSVGNMLEQSVPFLLAIWLHALAKSPTTAAWYGWLWLLLRALYPLAFSHPSWSPKLWGAQRRLGVSWVSFVTWPSYAIVWVLLIGAAQVI